MARSALRAGVTEEPSWELATLLSRLDGMRRTLRQRAELGQADQRLMWMLADRGPSTLREIAEALGLEQSTVNRQVNAALREGLVTRHREPGRTAWTFTATEKGLARFRHDVDLALGAYDAGLAGLSQRDRETFLRLLGRFVAAYDAAVHPPGGADP